MSESVVVLSTESQELESLDFQPEMACEGTDFDFPGCERDAAWWVTCRQCNNGRMLCDGCLAGLRAKVLERGVGAQCYRCQLHVPTLDGLAWITPVRSQR